MIPTTVKTLKEWLGRKSWRTATARRCHQCRAVIAQGLDADVCATTVQVDPTPLTPTGEAHALLAGIPTYTVDRTRTRSVRLTRRAGRWKPGAPPVHDVWPEHRCHQLHTDTTSTEIGRWTDQ